MIKSIKTDFCENNISEFVYCNSIDYSKCGNCKDEKCTLIKCGQEILTSYKNILVIYEDICIPRNISNQMKNEICLNFNEANSFRTYNECIYESNLNFNYISSRIYLIIIINQRSFFLFN